MRTILKPLAAALVWLAAAVAPAAAQSPAVQVVEQLYGNLLYVMQQADALGYDGRNRQLAPVVAATYDMPVIAKASIGRSWTAADEAQQQRLVDALSRLSVATYAARFDDYTGESFRVLAEEAAPRDMILVKSEIVKSNGEKVRIDYLVRQGDQGWRIVDIYLKGKYSELAVRRSEYNAILKRDGFEGLLAAIERKIADLRAEAVG